MGVQGQSTPSFFTIRQSNPGSLFVLIVDGLPVKSNTLDVSLESLSRMPMPLTKMKTAGDLCRESVFIEAEITNREVFDRFENNPILLNIPIVSEGEIVGLINRDNFMRSMARRFHWELYANKKCSKMMEAAPLTIDAETPITQIADRLLAEHGPHCLSDGFVIKHGKKLLGTGLTSDVLAALLSHQRVLAEELAQANQELLELTITDPLTGLHNRRHFNDVLPRELRRAHRNGDSVGLIMADIDYFKRLNDRLGHQAGDEALRHVALTLGCCVRRPSDYVFRLGGEEFAILTGNATAESAVALSEILRSKIEELQLSNPDHPQGIVTISLGIALSASGDSSDSLVRRADEALYDAKANGRNQVAKACTLA